MLIHNQMHWAGHVLRMDDDRLPKQLFYGELKVGKRPQHIPKKRYKDCVQKNLKALHIDANCWEENAMNRTACRKDNREGCSNFECQRLEHPPANLRT